MPDCFKEPWDLAEDFEEAREPFYSAFRSTD
jgi:hypothetical protein